MPRKSSRGAILNAADKVVRKVGANHLTLEAVAEKAGVSKGGLLYSFPTKEMLLKAMVTRQFEELEMARSKERVNLPEGPGREVKAHVLSLLNPCHGDEGIHTALFAAGAQDPRLLAPAQGLLKSMFDDFAATGLRHERAAAIGLATYGLYLMDLLGVSSFTVEQREAIVAELMRLADDRQAAGITPAKKLRGRKHAG